MEVFGLIWELILGMGLILGAFYLRSKGFVRFRYLLILLFIYGFWRVNEDDKEYEENQRIYREEQKVIVEENLRNNTRYIEYTRESESNEGDLFPEVSDEELQKSIEEEDAAERYYEEEVYE